MSSSRSVLNSLAAPANGPREAMSFWISLCPGCCPKECSENGDLTHTNDGLRWFKYTGTTSLAIHWQFKNSMPKILALDGKLEQYGENTVGHNINKYDKRIQFEYILDSHICWRNYIKHHQTAVDQYVRFVMRQASSYTWTGDDLRTPQVGCLNSEVSWPIWFWLHFGYLKIQIGINSINFHQALEQICWIWLVETCRNPHQSFNSLSRFIFFRSLDLVASESLTPTSSMNSWRVRNADRRVGYWDFWEKRCDNM